ncbi:MAG TPA: UbiX family flavin prenyltransferase [Alicyclobacillus sp.]|nr:UbiX family flavin prenyltransferase [Alicyclobacillus sp.]
MRMVVGMTGATGAILGIRTLQVLADLGIETHLVLSKWAEATIALETPFSVSEVRRMAAKAYSYNDQAAAISSGSFRTDGMVIVPCSMKSLASIRAGYGDNLLMRAADVTLKESRKLVIVPREMPLSEIHLENMLKLARMGVKIVPPMPAFYNKPETIEDIVDHIVCRILDQFGIDNNLSPRWM